VRCGPSSGSGPSSGEEKRARGGGKGEGELGCWGAWAGLTLGFLGRVLGFSWAGGFGLLGSFPFLLLFLFYFSLKLNYLNSKEILNSNPYEIKQLKQCISMNASTKLNLRKF
jgi:hypothetical protein